MTGVRLIWAASIVNLAILLADVVYNVLAGLLELGP
jgi:hypothetical protein